jgi:hypothetical protein
MTTTTRIIKIVLETKHNSYAIAQAMAKDTGFPTYLKAFPTISGIHVEFTNEPTSAATFAKVLAAFNRAEAEVAQRIG